MIAHVLLVLILINITTTTNNTAPKMPVIFYLKGQNSVFIFSIPSEIIGVFRKDFGKFLMRSFAWVNKKSKVLCCGGRGQYFSLRCLLLKLRS